MTTTPTHITGPADFAARFGDSRETLAKLETYETLLRQWQKAVNLVAPNTLDDVWHRHFADSAQLYALAPPAANLWTDLGSGAGFPGMVLAIMLAGRPAARMTLIESDQRKAAFLREIARRTGTTVDILSIRIENLPTHAKRCQAEVVTARALAPLARLLQLAYPLFASSTIGIFPKGREAAREVSEAKAAWDFEYELTPSVTDAEARIVVVRGLKAKTEV